MSASFKWLRVKNGKEKTITSRNHTSVYKPLVVKVVIPLIYLVLFAECFQAFPYLTILFEFDTIISYCTSRRIYVPNIMCFVEVA